MNIENKNSILQQIKENEFLRNFKVSFVKTSDKKDENAGYISGYFENEKLRLGLYLLEYLDNKYKLSIILDSEGLSFKSDLLIFSEDLITQMVETITKDMDSKIEKMSIIQSIMK